MSAKDETPPPGLAGRADMILYNGKIVTVDNNFSIAKAVAIRDGKIIAVEDGNRIMRYKGPKTKMINLKGATVLPGINDSHIHIKSFGVSIPPAKLDLNYPTVKSIADIVAAVEARVAQVSPGDWILGNGVDENYLDECKQDPNRRLTRWDLDPVSPNNPVALTGQHGLWCNSKAFELAGITKDTPNPPGGTIIKDPVTGEPIGILYEKATSLVTSIIPPLTVSQIREGILLAMQQLNRQGITSATEPGISTDLLGIYNDLYNEGKFTIRLNCLISAGISLEQMQNVVEHLGTLAGFGNEWLRIAGLKIVGDGIPPFRTGWVWEEYLPYPDGTPGGFGTLLVAGDTEEERYNTLINMIKYGNEHGFQIGIHATGDRAIDACVDGYIAALQEHPWDARHYTIHNELTRPETAQRMALWNIGANVSGGIKYHIASYMESILGVERNAYGFPLRTLIDAGLHVSNSSDAPSFGCDWKQGVETCVLREDKATGKVSGPQQCITVEETIRTYTIEGAWQDHQENIKGSIEVGKLADFCILGKDILTIDPHDISDIPTLMTIVGGRIVYDSGDLSVK